MAKKHSAKSTMEEELESYSKGSTPACSNDAKKILTIIGKHAQEIKKMKRRYLNDTDSEMFGVYSNIEAAFTLLAEDIEKEGFSLESILSQ